jgi:hypothetical protein
MKQQRVHHAAWWRGGGVACRGADAAAGATSGHVYPRRVGRCLRALCGRVSLFHIGADPVAVGLVASLNRPGGNVTGVSFLTYVAAPKRLGLLRDFIPSLNVLGLLTHARDPVAESVVTELTAAVRPFGIERTSSGPRASAISTALSRRWRTERSTRSSFSPNRSCEPE